MEKKLKDLKKGDIVYFSIYGYESEERIVKKVKVVDKAVLITIESPRPRNSYGATFFTGYYTSDIAIGSNESIIRTTNWALDKIKRLTARTDKVDMKNYKTATVLKAIRDIKDYLTDDDKCYE